MAQMFQADARFSGADVVVADGVPTDIVSTVPISVSFETAKAKVLCFLYGECGALLTEVQVEVFRNRDSENVSIGRMRNGVTPGDTYAQVSGGFVDEIPSPRDVSYTAVVTPTSANLEVHAAYIETTLLSG